MRRILGLVVKWATILAIVLILVALFGQPFLVEIPFTLAFGWIGFLRDNLAAMEVNPLLILEAVVSVALLAVGGHWFARWLYREMAPNAAGAWRPGWTVAGLGSVLLLFIAGIATIGITHQAAWLFTAKGPLLQDSWTDRWLVSEAILSASEARNAVAETFANTGKLPATNAEAGLKGAIKPRWATSISVEAEGVVRIEFPEPIGGGGVLTLTPEPEGGVLKWKCRSTLNPRHVPAECRG